MLYLNGASQQLHHHGFIAGKKIGLQTFIVATNILRK
jgi:hypothetical protein